MYTLVLILVGICILAIIGGIYREHVKEKRRARTWLASQPLESMISGRRKVAERGRALLEEQIDFDTFSKEFRQSQDPEIKNLVEIADAFFMNGLGMSSKASSGTQ